MTGDRIHGMALRAYQAAVPERIRGLVWRARRNARRLYCDARWFAMTRERRLRWTEKRLNLGGFFWLFILGCNNSGTTLLSALLGAHPLLRSLPKEGQRLTKAIPNAAELRIGRIFSERLDLFRWTEESDPSSVARLKYDWAAKYEPGQGVLLEKSPPNIVRSRWLQCNFQPSRFLAIVRHPYAVCEGIRRRRGRSIRQAAVHWNCVHKILEADAPYLKHYMLIQYEQLCAFPLETLKQIEKWMEMEPWFTEEYVSQGFPVHNMDGTANAIQNFNSKSFARLSPEDIRTIDHITERQMCRLGYEPLEGPGIESGGRDRSAPQPQC